MRDYLLAWRALPKLGVGGVFIAELFILLFGYNATLRLVQTLARGLAAHFEGATLLVTIVLAFGIAAGAGLFALNILSAVGRAAANSVLALLPVVRRKLPSYVRHLSGNPYELALQALREHGNFFVEVFSLKSQSFSLEALEKSAEVRKHTETAKRRLLDARVADIEGLVFQGTVTQERRAVEIVMDEVQVIENLVVVSLLAPVALYSAGVGGGTLVVVSLLALFILLALIPEVVYRKRFLAVFILGLLMELFVINEGADVADREGEPFL